MKESTDDIIKYGEPDEQVRSICTDEQVNIYSSNKKSLLKVPNVKRYRIAEGCEHTDKHAFDDCHMLESLYIPASYSEEEIDKILDFMPESVDNVCAWDRPYVDEIYDVNDYWYDETQARIDEYGVVYANEGRRLITATRPEQIGKDYIVPDGVVTVCDGAFGFCTDYLVLSLPRSIKVIGDYIFGEEGGKIIIRD